MSTRLRIPRRTRGESGATAIIVGLLSVVLFSLAGIAVDLGNAWARGRSIQKQADVSALASGYLLPQTTANKAAIADRVALVLNQNPTVGQQSGITGFQLINSDRSDGELLFQTPEGGPCLEDCPRMTLVPPPARVTFGLATVMGFEDVAVQRPATVEVQSALPPKHKMLPFWLPSGCGYGPTQADTTQGNSQGAPPPPESWLAPSSARMGATVTAAAPAPTPVGTHTLTGNAVTTVSNGQTTDIYGYGVTGVSTGKYKKVSLRAYSPDGSTFVDFAADLPSSGQVPPFQIGPQDLTGTSGDWYVFALAAKANGTVEYSANSLVIRVVGPSSPEPTASPTASPTETPVATASPSGVPIGCVGQDRGNFGQLDSPRAGYTSQQGFTLNLALGIDHSLAPYVFPPSIGEVKDCGPSSGVIPGGQLDNVAGAAGNGANCVKGDTGNDGPKTYEGLVAGVSASIPGRLDASRGSTACPSRSNLAVDGKQINNDSLACFLRNGATLDDLAQPGGVNPSMLSPEILSSPRLVYLPVVYASDRAQKSFQPIRQFVPGFITEETQTTGPNDAAGHINGLTISGNSVKVMSVFTFNRDALPPVEDADTVPYDPTMGGAIVRLVG